MRAGLRKEMLKSKCCISDAGVAEPKCAKLLKGIRKSQCARSGTKGAGPGRKRLRGDRELSRSATWLANEEDPMVHRPDMKTEEPKCASCLTGSGRPKRRKSKAGAAEPACAWLRRSDGSPNLAWSEASSGKPG